MNGKRGEKYAGNKLAERGGFEPPNGEIPLTVFETAAFDRSAISPEKYEKRVKLNIQREHENASAKRVFYQPDRDSAEVAVPSLEPKRRCPNVREEGGRRSLSVDFRPQTNRGRTRDISNIRAGNRGFPADLMLETWQGRCYWRAQIEQHSTSSRGETMRPRRRARFELK